MKTPSRLGGVCALITLLVGSALLAEESGIKATFVEPTAPEAASYRSAGSYAIDRLVMTMVTDCSSAVAGHKEVEALPSFHLKDVPMKGGTVAGLPRITAMKLTSFKLRNPSNAPDEAEKLALANVQSALDTGNPPRILVQRIERAGKTEWRVYKPLVNIRQCGTCHAKPDEQSPELHAALQQKYPEDASSSYSLGEWRGLIGVTVADAPAIPAGKK